MGCDEDAHEEDCGFEFLGLSMDERSILVFGFWAFRIYI